MQFRVDISIRQRGDAPFDWREIKSEHYDTDEEFAEAIKEAVLDSLGEYKEGYDDGTDHDG